MGLIIHLRESSLNKNIKFKKENYTNFSMIKAFVKTSLFLLLSFVFILTSVAISYGAVEQFSVYDTKMTFNENDTITVEKLIHLRNVHDVGIVPGEFEFVLFSSDHEDIELQNIVIKDRYDNDIKFRIIDSVDKKSIVMNLITPILPGFEYVIKMNYTFSYEDSGLLFKRMQVPLKEETRLPVLSGTVEIDIPSSKSFTYLSHTDNSTMINGSSVRYEIDATTPSALMVEYSWLPIRLVGLPGSLVFWTVINLFLVLTLFIQIKRQFFGKDN